MAPLSSFTESSPRGFIKNYSCFYQGIEAQRAKHPALTIDWAHKRLHPQCYPFRGPIILLKSPQPLVKIRRGSTCGCPLNSNHFSFLRSAKQICRSCFGPVPERLPSLLPTHRHCLYPTGAITRATTTITAQRATAIGFRRCIQKVTFEFSQTASLPRGTSGLNVFFANSVGYK
ncbi:hypothetical protein BC830DRAFT_919786 [Chytriomyces sp. MP71]|nr:hypothetical protein BC830DRAFT_919786 [Chytriomyces sp. MP71]